MCAHPIPMWPPQCGLFTAGTCSLRHHTVAISRVRLGSISSALPDMPSSLHHPLSMRCLVLTIPSWSKSGRAPSHSPWLWSGAVAAAGGRRAARPSPVTGNRRRRGRRSCSRSRVRPQSADGASLTSWEPVEAPPMARPSILGRYQVFIALGTAAARRPPSVAHAAGPHCDLWRRGFENFAS